MPDTKRLVLGSACSRAGVCCVAWGKGKEEDGVEVVENRRKNPPRGAAAAAAKADVVALMAIVACLLVKGFS